MAKGFTHESTYNESKEWYTPTYIFNALCLGFDLDPCSPGSRIVPWIPALHHFTLKDDGLIKPWRGNIWLNPPYGSDTPRWFKKLALHGRGIALVFSRTDVSWFHDYVSQADAICLIKGRVQFVPADSAYDYIHNLYEPKGGCGAGSMLVAFGIDNAKALFKCNLGLTLPVSKNAKKFRIVRDFAGGGRCPNENLLHVSESRQGNTKKK
jgi:hypothetical protein